MLKTKKLGSGRYAVMGTGIEIDKGDPPRYREPQMWFVSIGDDYLFEAKGKDRALDILERLAGELAMPSNPRL